MASNTPSNNNNVNINSTTTQSSTIDVRHYQEMHQMLTSSQTQPLRGQEVMVPMTGKAFLRGVLSSKKTTNTTSTNDKNKHNENNEEEDVILMNIGSDYLVEKPVSEAIKFLERRMMNIRTSDASPQLREPNQKKCSTNNAPQSKSVQQQQTQQKLLPCMDIREEYDANGNRMFAEAVDVQARLTAFAKMQKGLDDTDTTAASSSSSNKPQNDSKDILSDDGIEEEEERKKAKEKIDYDAISKRLDELILLEEQEAEAAATAKKKHKFRSSSTSKSGVGWNKGFLNASPKIKSKSKESRSQSQQSTTTTTTTKSTAAIKKPASARRSTSEPVRRSSNENGKNTDEASVQRTKSVQVRIRESLNETKEIPRIGSQSVKALKQPKPPPPPPRPSVGLVSRNSNLGRSAPRQQQNLNGHDSSSSSNSLSRPVHEFGSDVFGGIKERGAVADPSSSKQSNGVSLDEGSGETGVSAPKKKLSRFAQRRLEMKQREIQK